MEQKWILIAVIGLLVVGTVIAASAKLNQIPIGTSQLIQTTTETIVLSPRLIGDWISNIPHINSKNDLNNYLTLAHQRLLETNDEKNYVAVITFTKPLTKEELDRLVSQNKLKGLSVKFISSPDGSGQYTYPISEEDWKELKKQEAFLKQEFAKAKADDPTTIVPENFELVKGFISLTVQNNGKILKQVQHPNIALIDVGPTSYNKSLFSLVFPAKDIYYEWQQYNQ